MRILFSFSFFLPPSLSLSLSLSWARESPNRRGRSNLRINIHTSIRRLMNIDAPGAHRVYTKTKNNRGRRIRARARARGPKERTIVRRGGSEGAWARRLHHPALPPPVCAHLSHGGGAPRDAALHAFYTAAAIFKIARCATR